VLPPKEKGSGKNRTKRPGVGKSSVRGGVVYTKGRGVTKANHPELRKERLSMGVPTSRHPISRKTGWRTSREKEIQWEIGVGTNSYEEWGTKNKNKKHLTARQHGLQSNS